MKETYIEIEPQIKSNILDEAIDYVQKFYHKNFIEGPLFHSLGYTREIASVANDLADYYKLKNEEREILLLASWFFNTGFLKDQKNFIDESIRIAENFLTKKSYPKEKIKEVTELLKNSDASKDDLGLKGQIFHDAIISYKGRKRFFRKAELLRVERENLLKKSYEDHDWEKIQYDLLTRCSFYTDAAHEEFQKRKLKNIKKQRSRVQKAKKATTRVKTGKDLGRGVDTLYRASYRNHINLSSIADGKANMMISINTIILSVIVTLSGAGFTFSETFIVDHLRYTVPIFILLLGALVSVIFAILSARPKVTEEKIDMEKVESNKMSLLYFGNFLNIPLDQFVRHLSTLKKNQQKVYDSMSVDLYYLGEVLRRKYHLLTWSYNVFMAALVLSVAAFSAIFFYTNL